jgi:hypothetical protein
MTRSIPRRPLALLAAVALLGLVIASTTWSRANAEPILTGGATRIVSSVCLDTSDANAIIDCTLSATEATALNLGTGATKHHLVWQDATITFPIGGQSNLLDHVVFVRVVTDSAGVVHVLWRGIGTQIVHYPGPEPGGHDGPLAYRNAKAGLTLLLVSKANPA